MDNLRSLDSSLPTPGTSHRHRVSNTARQSNPPNQQDLLQAFKTAALSVTNLYRAAAAESISSSYSDGYRDALEDLVGFLDREDLGLNDGEGWRVRQYLAEKLAQGPAFAATGPQTTTDASEDEVGDAEEEKRARSSSPVLQSRTAAQQQQTPVTTRARSSTPPKSEAASGQQQGLPQTQFTFQAGETMHDMDVDGPHSYQQNGPRSAQKTRHGTATLRVNSQSHNRTAMSLTGSKRKLPFIDFFDITDFGNGKDGNGGGAGGGKRSRLN